MPRRNSIHGWIGGRFGSPTEYGQPLDDSFLYELEGEEEADPEPPPCACGGQDWTGCECQAVPEEEEEEYSWLDQMDLEVQDQQGDDWTPVRVEVFQGTNQ